MSKALQLKFNCSVSGVMLLAANLVPLFGVVLFGWKVFLIIFLYWMENVIIGVLNVLRMLCNQPDNIGLWFFKLFIIPFFMVHYGLFTAVHGMFVFSMFGNEMIGEVTPHAVYSFVQTPEGLLLGLLVLFFSHVFSFFFNYLYQGEYKKTNLNALMVQPYKRVIILHVVILFGGFLVLGLGSPVPALILLVVLKSVIDLTAHQKEHADNRQAEATER